MAPDRPVPARRETLARLFRVGGWLFGSVDVGPIDRGPLFRPRLEALDDRVVPTVFNVTASDTTGLINAINAANDEIANPGADTINISGTYTFTTPDNYWYGPDALPAIASDITIQGDPATGAIIQRDPSLGTGTPFRLFYVSGGFSGVAAGTLTLRISPSRRLCEGR